MNPSTAAKYRDAGLLVIRIGLGLFYMIVHGAPKLFGGPEKWTTVGEAVQYVGIDFLPIFWGFMAGFVEFTGGLLLALGFLYRPAVFFLFCVMIIASAENIGTGMGFVGASRPMEMAIVLVGLFLIGPGRYSLDDYLQHRYRTGF